MLSSVLNHAAAYPKRLAAALTHDPAALIDKLQDRIVQTWEYRNPVHHYEAQYDWEHTLHNWLGLDWPCAQQSEFWTPWLQTVEHVRGQGVNVGPESFAGFNDGDTALVRAIWCLVRHLRPQQVVETGVAHGFTSRLILEALARNGSGGLFSIDRPPLNPETRARVGIAVPPNLRSRWNLIAGSSRRRLPGLLKSLGTIDLFIHDSLHTERNVRFELDRAWRSLRPGGALVIDDIDSNGGFGSFCRAFSGFRAVICEAEPVRPDERRFNRKGLFAIVLKDNPSTSE
ncbi:MAG TPA: class I SAM-dependent methyltransferase [Rhizomicrobium sp.]